MLRQLPRATISDTGYLLRLLACLGVNNLKDPRRDPRPELSATPAVRRIPLWDLDDY